MEIIINKGEHRNTLYCKRADGTFTSENLGPEIPNHDIAHFVVEKKFNLTKGFYGNIAAGMTIKDLSNKDIIKNLDSESWLAEIMTRNLQSLGSGAAIIEEYIELVTWEASTMKNIQIPTMNLPQIHEMKAEYDALCKQWKLLPIHGELRLQF
ncbi:hypothetical protein [uncultured Kordia sp.]|uniref:hypothetical protein n=1 Tax=uncultured Kordia sp. TaxID=507699 RepID=UPI0026194D3B|nr:hypothetical protein [uncultured Kordia sp.]